MTSPRSDQNPPPASATQGARGTGGSTSRSLLAAARLEDPIAWERLVNLYAPLVASWCRRWNVPEQDVVDLVQDVFAAVAGNLDRFRKEQPADTFRGWLLTIARNKVRDHFRRRAREPAAGGGTEASVRIQQMPAVESGVDDSEINNAALFSQGQRALWAGEAGWMAGAFVFCLLQAREWCGSMRLPSQ